MHKVMQFDFKYSSFWTYYYIVKIKQIQFNHILRKISSSKNQFDKLILANRAAYMAWHVSSGYHSCAAIENVFLEFAKSIPEVDCSPQKGTILHVLTQCYCSGGHTRVVERWILNSNKDEKHSVLILNQNNETIPIWLVRATKDSGGKLIVLEEEDQLKRAYILRKIASEYEKIVLHVHMDDGTPIIAFGVDSFKIPIILFNHADHVCWVGVSIADIVADIRYNTKTIDYRSASKSTFLGIPPSKGDELFSDTTKDRNYCRNVLGFKKDDFIILSTADDMKYRPIGKYDYVKVLMPIVKKYGIKVLSIGGNPNNKYWKNAYIESNGLISALGVVSDKNKYMSYLMCADLYVSSFPFASFTSMMDAAQLGIPCMQLQVSHQKNSMWGIDIKESNSIIWINSIKNLQKNIVLFLTNPQYRVNLISETKRWINDYASNKEWKERLYRLYNECPSKHSIHKFIDKNGKNIVINDECVLNNHMYSSTPMNFFDLLLSYVNLLIVKWKKIKK